MQLGEAHNTRNCALALLAPKSFEDALEQQAKVTDRTLAELIPDDGTKLHAAMRYALLGGGKKLRPFFVTQSAAIFGVPAAETTRVGAALECVHTYSLIHDDLPAMDNDDLRRGQPTLHKQFDEATAILAGDALLTLAFGILADSETHTDANVRTQLILHLAKAAGDQGMVDGQMLDIEAETRNFSSLAEISAMQSKKTGALFRFACESGAIIAQQDRTQLRQYADNIGLAFQIADDILDVESNPAALGKATQKDKAKGKATFVDFLGLDGAKAEANRLAQSAVDALSGYDKSADWLRAAANFVVSRKK